MIDISVQDVHKFYGDNHVLKGVTFDVQSGEHIGLIGANGAGKTTLFRVLSGEELPDKGSFALFSGKSMGLLSQIPIVEEGATVAMVLDSAFSKLYEMQAEIDALLARCDDPKVLTRYGELAHLFETRGGFEIDLRLSRVRNGLMIPDSLYYSPFAALSGGEKTRVNLARLILLDTDILLLDEPTNHLDMRATEWLEDYLSRFKGTVVCISHDRYFLDNCINRVIEVENGVAVPYSGNYSFYVIEKKRRYDEQMDQFIKENRKITQLQDTARRMHDYAGKSAKLHKRAFAIEKRAERMKTVDKPRTTKSMTAHFKQTKFLADDVLRIQELSFAYFGGKVLVNDLTATVRPGDRIALLGENGAGKTTLFKLITEELTPTKGRILPGPSVKKAYLPQVIEFSHPERTLYDTMLYEDDCLPQESRDRLGMFHFRGEEVFKQVENLSGGERSRLKLCLLMGDKVNLLLLDEPTNHLDIASREWIEEAVESYDETLIFISHDRYFIDRFANRIWELSGGKICDFTGTFEEFKQYKSALAFELEQEKLKAASSETNSEKSLKPHQAQMKSKETEKRIRQLEREMEQLDEADAELSVQLELSSSDSEALTRLLSLREENRNKYQNIFTQWEELIE